MDAIPFRLIRARHAFGPTLYVRVIAASADGASSSIVYGEKSEATVFPGETPLSARLLAARDATFHAQPVTDLALRA
jgi:hypothetical protein